MNMIRPLHTRLPERFAHPAAALALACVLGATSAFAQTQNSTLGGYPDLPGQVDTSSNSALRTDMPGNGTDSSTPAQLRQATSVNADRTKLREPQLPFIALPPYAPNEFERFVNTLNILPADAPIRRFGANLLTDNVPGSSTQDPLPSIPGNYVIKPGDEIALTIWGSADANLRLVVDRSGTISIPRVGAINVGGVPYADLAATIRRRVGSVFRDFQLSASVGQVRAIRIFVSGYAQRPGSVTVSGLSSVLHAIMAAGGPSMAGSFRDIRLNRAGKQVATYDLYDLLLKGDRGADELVQPDDVVFIGPIGTQIAVLGSVNQQAVFELKPGEGVGDALTMAGGFTAVADRTRVTIERLADRDTGHVTELRLPQFAQMPLATGDVLWAFSAVSAVLPKDAQNKRVHVDGEVARPGDYVLPPGSTTADALRAAGGLTRAAYPYGADFTRQSVRLTQQANYDRALRELETSIAKSQATQRVTTAEEANARSASGEASSRLLARLRDLRPSGRVVLELDPTSTTVPTLPLEDGDSLNVPARDTAVGVFGSVFNTGSFMFKPDRYTLDYLHLAGGPTRGADRKSMFVIRANGSVVSAQQGSSFWHSGNEFDELRVQPGDTIFVPEELDKSTFVQDAKDWTQILYQFGLGVAGIKSLGL
jgi:protein involved in polysaccharide export with SLBB domain